MPLSIPTLAEVQADRVGKALPKGAPLVVQRAQKRTAKKTAEERFRDAVWSRDQGKSRASDVPVVPGHVDNRKRGEVAHLPTATRSTNPEKRLDPRFAILLTAEEHALSDPRTAPGSKVLLEIRGTDARKAITFIRRDAQTGKVLWRRVSTPPKAAR